VQLDATITVRGDDENERGSGIWRAGSHDYRVAVSTAVYQPVIASELLYSRANVALEIRLLGRLLSGRGSNKECDEKGCDHVSSAA